MSEVKVERQEFVTSRTFQSPPAALPNQNVQTTVAQQSYQFQYLRNNQQNDFNNYQSGVINNYSSLRQKSQQKRARSGCSGCYTQNYQQQSGCSPCQPVQECVAMYVVSKDDIERPWRDEYQYLQSVIENLEKNKKTEVQVVTQVDNSRVQTLEEQIRNAKAQLAQQQYKNDDILNDKRRQQEDLRAAILSCQQRIDELMSQEIVTEQISYLSNEAELWKKKYNDTYRDFQDKEKEATALEQELALLKAEKMKQRQEQSSSQTVVTRSVRREGTASGINRLQIQ